MILDVTVFVFVSVFVFLLPSSAFILIADFGDIIDSSNVTETETGYPNDVFNNDWMPVYASFDEQDTVTDHGSGPSSDEPVPESTTEATVTDSGEYEQRESLASLKPVDRRRRSPSGENLHERKPSDAVTKAGDPVFDADITISVRMQPHSVYGDRATDRYGATGEPSREWSPSPADARCHRRGPRGENLSKMQLAKTVSAITSITSITDVVEDQARCCSECSPIPGNAPVRNVDDDDDDENEDGDVKNDEGDDVIGDDADGENMETPSE